MRGAVLLCCTEHCQATHPGHPHLEKWAALPLCHLRISAWQRAGRQLVVGTALGYLQGGNAKVLG